MLGIIASMLLSGCTEQEGGGLVAINKTSSCSEPYIVSAWGCCLDMDGNGICDSLDGAPAETASTLPEETGGDVKPPAVAGSCMDGLRNGNETGVDCGGACRPCRTPCELFINSTGVKPAARTTMLCLSSKEQTFYGGYNLSVINSDEGLIIGGYDANGSLETTFIKEGRDMSIGSVAFRYIGRVRKNATTYVWVYAWVPEDGIRCSLNSDCEAGNVSSYVCIDNRVIVKQYYTYRCIEPGTIFSQCRVQQNQEQVKVCTEGYMCVSGDDRCFPKECFDGAMTKDEDSIDCGGSCRPCHCFNGLLDAGETGIDCEGGCKPCLGNYSRDMTAPNVAISSPLDTVYDSQKIDLNYGTDEPVEWCGYSVNGRPNITILHNGTIYADEGKNTVVLSCRDNAGNAGYATRKFSVHKKDTLVCPLDNTSVAYSEHFDSVVVYLDTERELGVPDRCDQKLFDYALTYVNDSSLHYRADDVTNVSSDGNLTASNLFLGYECRALWNFEAGYAVLKKNLPARSYASAKMVLYYTQKSAGSMEGSFWRIYAYEREADVPNEGRHMDVAYRPTQSRCGGDKNVSYQEFDLSALLPGMGDVLHLRIGFYGQNQNHGVDITEAEVFLEPAGKV